MIKEKDAKMKYWNQYWFDFNDDKGDYRHIDFSIIRYVVYDIINKYNKDILHWRFHRRFNEDKAGHIFKLFVFTDKSIGQQVKTDIDTNLLSKLLLTHRILKSIDWKEENKSDGLNDKVEGILDAQKWTIEIKKSWIHFAEGVSKLMMDWILLYDAPKIDSNTNFTEIDKRYKTIQDDFEGKILKDGQHAFIHHLDAFFGYIFHKWNEK